MTRFAGALLLWMFCIAAQAELLIMEVVPLKHRLADDLVPTLRELVAEGGTVTGLNNQIIIRSTPANLADLKHVLEGLDTRQQQLRITVRQNVGDSSQGAADALAAHVRAGPAEVAAGLGGPGDAPGAGLRYQGEHAGVSVESYRTHGQDERASSHFVMAIEGTPAYIATGVSVPLPESSAVITPYGANVQQSLNYRNVGSGVYVTPRLAGDDVTLEISPYNEQLAARGGGVIAERSVNTVVRGRLGEWLPLGGASTASHDSSRSELTTTERHADEAYDVWVKVEVAP